MSKDRSTEDGLDQAELPVLPPGWCWARVGEVGEVKLGRQRSPEHHTGTHMRPYLRVANVYEDRIDLSDVLEMNFTPEEFEQYQLRYGDILLNEGQSLEWVGRPAMYRDELPGSCFQNTLVRFRPHPGVDGRFALLIFRHYLHSRRFQQIARWTVNIAHLGAGRFAEVEFPVPPIREQERIVAKAEELLTDLDAGVAALKRAKANLKRYRASVLKAAVEGRLTAEWRAKHPHAEPASKLLDRILAERRRRWEAEQEAKFAAAEKTPPKNWQEKYPEPIRPDPKGVPPLPDGWCWATVDQITANFDGIRVPVKAADRASRQGEYPYYGASGVIDAVDGYLFDGEYLLIAEDGANLLSRSTPIAFQAAGRFWVNNHAHIVQLFSGMPLAYLEHYLNGTRLDFFITGTAQPKLTQASLNKIPVPLPPIAEQQQIVAEVEQRLTVITANGQQIDADLKRAVRLRQSLLKRAFEGKLVPQDPTDDPASVLLERIRADRLSTSTGGPHADARNGQPARRTTRRRG